MQCKEKGCNGSLNDEQKAFSIRTGCASFSPVVSCKSCGRLHFLNDGKLVFNRPGNKAYLRDKKIVHINEEGEEV